MDKMLLVNQLFTEGECVWTDLLRNKRMLLELEDPVLQ